MEWTKSRRCCHCKDYLTLDNFGRDKNKKSGLNICCKKCKRDLQNEKRSKKVVPRKNTSPLAYILLEDRAYMAGLFDGEGCIIIVKETGKVSYRLQLSLGSKDKCITDWVHEHFGGRVCHTKLDVYNWCSTSLEAGEILKTFIDFLVLKRGRARLALEFLEKTSKRITLTTWDEQLKIREYYLQEIRKRNRREL